MAPLLKKILICSFPPTLLLVRIFFFDVIQSDLALYLNSGGFYVTNANNEFIGNAAVGGFAGFSFVNLPTGIGTNKTPNRSSTPKLIFVSSSFQRIAS